MRATQLVRRGRGVAGLAGAALCWVIFVAGAAPDRRVVFLGDSLTAGYGVEFHQAFPALVQDKINARGLRVQVVNAGQSGDTSAGGLGRIDWLLKNPVDVLVLELGGNDGLRGLPVAVTKKNLQAIIDRTRARYPKAKVVIAGMQVPPNMGSQYGRQFAALYPELAKKNQAALVPFLLEGVGGVRELNLSDGIHPTAKGHEIIARNVWKVLEPLLQSPVSSRR